MANKWYVLPALLMALCATGCDRLALTGDSTVTFTVPRTDELQSKGLTVQGGDFNATIPTGFDGNKPLNCFLLFVGGPEESMRKNQCGRSDSAAKIPVGVRVGGVAPGESISIDVPSGKDRVVSLIGFHAEAGGCYDFIAKEMDESKLSEPYLLAIKGGLEMKPGQVMDLPMQMTYDSSRRIEDCNGPDFNDGPGDGTGTTPLAAQIQIRKDYFPVNQFVHNQCQSVDAVLVSSMGYETTSDSIVNFVMNKSGSALTTYAQWEDCLNNNPLSPGYVHHIPVGSNRKQIIFKMYSESTVDLTAANISPATLTAIPFSGTGYSSSTPTFDWMGPNRILPNICYPYVLLHRSVGGEGAVNTAATVSISKSGAIDVFSDPGCSATLSTVGLSPGQTQSLVYVRMGSGSHEASVVATATSHAPAAKRFFAGSGTNVAVGLELFGANQLEKDSCSSAYAAQLINSHGTAVLASAAIPLSYPTMSMDYYSGAGCGGTPNPSLEIAAGTSAIKFWVKPRLAGALSIYLSASGLIGGSQPINVNGVAQISLTDITSGAPTINSCRHFIVQTLNSTYALRQTLVDLTLTADSPFATYSDPACTTSISPVISASTDQVTFYVMMPSTSGLVDLTIRTTDPSLVKTNSINVDP